ncbi:MAG: TGS domain-containing protein [Candidatus Syntrophopropionicum ammoniitolerans]
MGEANQIAITLPDGSTRDYPYGTTAWNIARDISPRLGREALAAKIDGKPADLGLPLKQDATVEILTFDDEEGQEVYRHSTAHVMAQAVQKLFPDVQLAIGPAIANGYYYDFDTREPFVPEDLAKIEKEMKTIIKADLPFERTELSRSEALDLFEKLGQSYKIELIEDLPEDVQISIYRQGDFTDLCMGPMFLLQGV